MEIREFRVLRGPNIWTNYPCVEAFVDLGEYKDSPSTDLPGFNGRLMSYLPSMIEHRCSVGERGGFFQRLRRGTYLGHILEHVAIELHALAGVEIGFGRTRETSQEGLYRVVIRHDDEDLCKECLLVGRELCMAAIHDTPFDLAAESARLYEMAQRLCLGPSTKAIVAAAKKRGIPTRRLNVGSLVLFGNGIHARRIWTAVTDRTSAIGETIASDKDLTKSLLKSAGIPVPEGRLVTSAEDAWEATEELGSAVVIKPRDANHGRAVFAGLTEKSEVEIAYRNADEEGNGVLIERFVSGAEHRLLVVGGKMIAAARGDYAYVTGDGKSTIAELVESQLNADPRRGDDESCPLNRVVLDAANCVTLDQQGYSPDSVPLKSTKVLIQRSDTLATDVTDEVHPSVAEMAVQSARVVGLDIAGIDILCRDIGQPLVEQGGIMVEVNSGPGLLMHLSPARGESRPVGEAIVETMFPLGTDGRIPIVAVAGSHGAAEVTRLVEHLWKMAEPRVSVAASYGMSVNGKTLTSANSATNLAQHNMLINPKVAAALFQVSTECALCEGIAFDGCQVAVVTNVDPSEDLSPWRFEGVERAVQAHRVAVDVVLPTGFAVLSAADPLVVEMAEKTDGSVIFFAADPENPVIVAHRQEGGKAVFLRDGVLNLVESPSERRVTSLSEIGWLEPTSAAQCELVLAAASAAWALGLDPELIREGLQSFVPAAEKAAILEVENH